MALQEFESTRGTQVITIQKYAIKYNLKWSTQMILEVRHTVYVPPSSHGAAQA